MTLGDLNSLRVRLGGEIGLTYACALKKAAGYGGRRWFDLDAVCLWLAENPDWKMSDTYKKRPITPQRPCKPKGRKAAVVGKSGGRS